ncbi:MAG TPA: type I restriction endonuclease subunit R, partial [Chloroflexota bacterium]
LEVQQAIDIESYRIQKTSSGKIKLERGTAELDPIGLKEPGTPHADEVEALSKIIAELNRRFGTDFTADDRVFIQQLEARLANDAALEASVRVNTPDNARLTFDHVVQDLLQDMIETNFRFYKQINDDRDFATFFFDWLFDRYHKRRQTRGEPSASAELTPAQRRE